MQGLVTVGVYKDVDVSTEIDGLRNMQDIVESRSPYRVSSMATHREIKEAEMIRSQGEMLRA